MSIPTYTPPTYTQDDVNRFVEKRVRQEKIALIDYLIQVAQANPKDELWRALFAEMRHNLEEKK